MISVARIGRASYNVFNQDMPRRASKAALTLALVLAAVLLTACGSDDGGGDSGGAAPDYEEALAGAPGPLAALHGQANELLPGEAEAFEKRLGELEGYPVVVNKWASWCGPCRLEFPFFQNLAARYGKQVAFIGVDSDDSPDAAATFLAEYPVPYPSYSDPDQEVAEVFNATLGFPSTAFYDEEGELVYLKQGGYAEQADLEADIRAQALGS
jgi:cytochrome c biogenesis protein CcmG, thiol:disulfide interchange protein DsbE